VFQALDEAGLRAAGRLAGRWPLLDRIIVKFTDLSSVKLLPLMAVVVFLWFSACDRERRRAAALVAITGMLAAVAVSRSIQNLSPLHLRPLHSGNPLFVKPEGVDTTTLEHWSSFPSDHAAVAFALATAVCRASRPLGLLCYVWAVLVVGLPRIYAGYHYVSDVLAGALIGILIVGLIWTVLPVRRVVAHAERLSETYPGLFGVGLFVLVFWFATMFADVREIARSLAKHAPG